MQSTGAYNFPNFKRGDTFLGRDIASLTQEDLPVTIYRAAMELRTKGGELIYRWDTEIDPATASITGDTNTVTLHEVETAATSLWPLGVHVYDLAVWYQADGDKHTILEGRMDVRKTVTSN